MDSQLLIDAIIPLLSLIALEVILGIENIIFISILADKLPSGQTSVLGNWPCDGYETCIVSSDFLDIEA